MLKSCYDVKEKMKVKRKMRKKTKISGRKRIRTKKDRKQQLFLRIGIVSVMILLLLGNAERINDTLSNRRNEYREKTGDEIDRTRPDMDVKLLTVNPYSRPGTKTNKINGIVIHYTANPGSTAMQNRDYFEGLKSSHKTKASSHFIIGLEGEIVQCVPTWEVAYASNNRNSDTVSIETCHPKQDGKYTKQTYKSMVELTAWLCRKFELTEEDVIRHYDVTGKNCPKYFVENEEAWKKFKKDVKKALE